MPNLKNALKPRAVLALYPAGFGDMLRQINKFLWVADFYGLRSSVFFENVNERNEISVGEFSERLHITNLNLLSDDFDYRKALNFNNFSDVATRRTTPFSTYYFEWGRKGYSANFPEELHKAYQKNIRV